MSRRTDCPDIPADPFHERGPRLPYARMRLLGCDFEFETDSPRLRAIVGRAYTGLPPHKFPAAPPRVRITLMPAPRERKATRGEIPRIEMFSGADFLGAATSSSDFVVLSAAQRTGLIVVSASLLRHAYHVRYELIEFAVFTLASRVLGLVGLHAACIGRGGRGLLLIGASGAGKSTATLHSLLRGLEFLSEDSVFVAPDSLLATGVPNFLHVRRDALRFVTGAAATLIRRSPVIKRRSGVEKYELDLRQPGFHLAPRPLQIVGCVYLSAEKPNNPGSLVTPLHSAAVLKRLRAEQPYAANQVGWRRFSQRFLRVPAFELRRGCHPTETVEALEEILVRTKKH